MGQKQFNKKQKSPNKNIDPLPAKLLQQYPEQHVVFSEDEQRVIGAGETAEEAAAQAEASGVKGLWHWGYSEWPRHPNGR